MKTFKSYITEAKVSMAKLSAGMKVDVIHTGRSARNYGIKDENVYGGKVQVLGIGIVPFNKQPKPNMVISKDLKEFKKKYEKIFKSEEIQYGQFFNARHRLKAAFSKISEEDKRVKPGFGAYIWKVIDGENKGHVSYCYIGNDRNDNWEVRFLNKSTEFILET